MCNARACDAPVKFDPTLSDGSHPNFHTLCHLYCARGQAENLIKLHKA